MNEPAAAWAPARLRDGDGREVIALINQRFEAQEAPLGQGGVDLDSGEKTAEKVSLEPYQARWIRLN